jgi:hypothetical protein
MDLTFYERDPNNRVYIRDANGSGYGWSITGTNVSISPIMDISFNSSLLRSSSQLMQQSLESSLFHKGPLVIELYGQNMLNCLNLYNILEQRRIYLNLSPSRPKSAMPMRPSARTGVAEQLPRRVLYQDILVRTQRDWALYKHSE